MFELKIGLLKLLELIYRTLNLFKTNLYSRKPLMSSLISSSLKLSITFLMQPSRFDQIREVSTVSPIVPRLKRTS